MANAFLDRLAKGKEGEELIMAYLRERGNTVLDCTGDSYYKKRDIDILSSKNGKDFVPIEVKTDEQMHKTGNMAIEISMDRQIGRTMGWFFYCEAEIMCYIDYHGKIAYFIDWPKLQQMVPGFVDAGKWNVIRFWNNYDKCYGHLCLVSIDEIKKRELVYLETKIA